MFDNSDNNQFEKMPGAGETKEAPEISEAQQQKYDQWSQTMEGLAEANPWTDPNLNMEEPAQFAAYAPAEQAPTSYTQMPGIEMYDKDRSLIASDIDNTATEAGNFLSDITGGEKSDALDVQSGDVVMREMIEESIDGRDGIGIRGTEQSLKTQGLNDTTIGNIVDNQVVGIQMAEAQARVDEDASDVDRNKAAINAAAAASAEALRADVRANEAATAIINEDTNAEQLIQDSNEAAQNAARIAQTAMEAAGNIRNPEELSENITESAQEAIMVAQAAGDKITDAKEQLSKIQATKEQIENEPTEEQSSENQPEQAFENQPEQNTEEASDAQTQPEAPIDPFKASLDNLTESASAPNLSPEADLTANNPLNAAVDQIIANAPDTSRLQYKQGVAPSAEDIRRAMTGTEF